MVNKQRVKNILLHNIYFLSLKSSYSSYSTFATHWRIDFSNWCWEPLCKITCSTVQTRNSEIIVCIPPPRPPALYVGESESDPLWTVAERGEVLNLCEIEVLIPVLLNTHVLWDVSLCGLETLALRCSVTSQKTWILTIQTSPTERLCSPKLRSYFLWR
jgi:hypothetical protein